MDLILNFYAELAELPDKRAKKTARADLRGRLTGLGIPMNPPKDGEDADGDDQQPQT